MIISEAKFSEAYTKLRFDAEYFKTEFIETRYRLEKINASKLTSIAEISKLRRDPTKESDKEFIYIDISNIDTSVADVSTQKIIGYKAPTRARKLVQTGDVIVSTVRPNRNAVAIIPKELDNSVCSTGFCVLKPTEVNLHYLFVFLKTKYAINQLVRETMASMYPAVSEDQIKKILVFLPSFEFQFHVEKLVKEAFSKRKLADEKYKQAKQLLEKELGLDKLKLKEEKTFEAKSSELFGSRRFDSEYYKPKCKQIIRFLKNSGFEVKKLKEIVKISNKKIDPTKEPTKRFRYVPIAKINSNGEIDEWDEFNGWQAPSRARMLIKKGDVLVSSLGGSLNKIALVPEELNNSIATTGTFVINSENFYSEFLFLLFRTELIKLQLERKTAGAIMTAVPKTTFGNLLIPIIPKQKQENIAKLINQSFTLRKEAKQLLEEAKEKVESMIENPLEISETQPVLRSPDKIGTKGEPEIIIPFPIPSKLISLKPPVKVKYKDYQMLDGSIKKLVQQIGDGSIIKRFEKTPIPKSKIDVVCPHFLELKWATGCPYDCSWCYLKGTFRFLPYKAKPHIKDFDKIEKHTKTFLEYVQTPEVLNTGELADSLMLEVKNKSFVKFIVPLFENQNKHKILFLSKSNKIENLLLLNTHRQVIVSFSLNAIPVAQRWEKKAPSVEDRIKAAGILYKQRFEVRIRIDPMIPVENWEQLYTDLIDRIFNSFIPERITLGSLRGLQSTINGTSDKSWVKYLSERSNWGRKIDINLRLAMYKTIISYLNEKYKYNKVALCKETLAIWDILNTNYKNIKCNCVW